jgi:hypothetical protein
VNSQAAGSCGKRKLVRIPWKAFISRVLNLSYLIGEGESIPNISTSKKAIWRGFLTYPEFFPPPPQTVGHGVGCVCVYVCVCVGPALFKAKVVGSTKLGRQISGQPGHGRAVLPSPALLSVASPHLLGSPIQCGIKFPGKQGTRGTFEFTNGIKIYIFYDNGQVSIG